MLERSDTSEWMKEWYNGSVSLQYLNQDQACSPKIGPKITKPYQCTFPVSLGNFAETVESKDKKFFEMFI